MDLERTFDQPIKSNIKLNVTATFINYQNPKENFTEIRNTFILVSVPTLQDKVSVEPINPWNNLDLKSNYHIIFRRFRRHSDTVHCTY